MEKITFNPINNGCEVYSEEFSRSGWFIVDRVDLRPNNKYTNKKLVAIVKAHLKDDPSFLVEATSDKFTF